MTKLNKWQKPPGHTGLENPCRSAGNILWWKPFSGRMSVNLLVITLTIQLISCQDQLKAQRLSKDWLYFAQELIRQHTDFTLLNWRISLMLGATLAASTVPPPPPSLVTGERRQRLTKARPEWTTTARGRSRGDRGLPEMRLEAVYRNHVWCAADVHDKILHARYPDAVRPPIGGRQARQEGRGPQVHEGRRLQGLERRRR
jgi:hypothetical protein